MELYEKNIDLYPGLEIKSGVKKEKNYICSKKVVKNNKTHRKKWSYGAKRKIFAYNSKMDRKIY